MLPLSIGLQNPLRVGRFLLDPFGIPRILGAVYYRVCLFVNLFFIFCRFVLILQHIPQISRLYVFHRTFKQEFGRFCDNLPIEPGGVPSLPNVGLGSTTDSDGYPQFGPLSGVEQT